MRGKDKIAVGAALGIVISLGAWVGTYPQEEELKSFTIEPPHISSLYPELENWDGLVRYYKPAYFPRLDQKGCEKPDIEKWVSSLEPFDHPAEDDEFIKVWFKGSKLRFMYIQSDCTRSGRFFAISSNSIEMTGIIDYTISLFVTPVGVVKWEYIYRNGLLVMEKSYAFGIDSNGKITCDRLWGYDRIEFWQDTRFPKHRYRYGYYRLDEQDWYERVDYDSVGNKLRTVNAAPKADNSQE